MDEDADRRRVGQNGNPPEPARLLERLTKFLNGGETRLGAFRRSM